MFVISKMILSSLLLAFLSSLCFLYCKADGNVESYYARDPLKAIKLAIAEENIVSEFTDIINGKSKSSKKRSKTPTTEIPSCALKKSDKPCREHVSRYIKEFKQDTNHVVNGRSGMLRAEIISENPILIFKMMKRIYINLISETMPACETSSLKVRETILEKFKSAKLDFPTKNDWEDALKGLIVLQFVYGLKSEDLRHGILYGTRTYAILNHDHCIFLAQKALEMKGEVLAYQWLQSAILSANQQSIDLNKLGDLTLEVDKIWEGLGRVKETSSRDLIQEIMKNETQQRRLKGYSIFKRHAPCRGEITMSIEDQSQFKCHLLFTRSLYFVINPLKMEVISAQNALFFQIHDFVSSKAIGLIKELDLGEENGKPEMQMADLRKTNRYIDPVLMNLHKSLEKVTGYWMEPWRARMLRRALRTPLGIYSNAHSLRGKFLPSFPQYDKMATILMFLNDVKMGGYISIDKLGTYVEPIKGSILVWYPPPPKKEGDKDRTIVECPVIMGSKETAIQWVLFSEVQDR